ncbi:MAG: flagellar hook-basal body complex protein [Dorea sp.]|jgi:flagellar hook protein FlgE|nr:flagellar hook-basal body complex protein [Dorea sp.]
MVRSMVAAVAGLKTHQSKMDVIGNNIANVNTWGFKSYSFNFQDSMYANSINGSGGSTEAGAAGGRNASQVGYGSTLSSITTEFGTGAPSPSANPLDCMIDGTGFFLVGNMVNGTFTNIEGSGLFLSRVGIFRVDNNGYLVDDQRSYVYGYAVVDGTGTPEQPSTAAKYTYTGVPMTITDKAAPDTGSTIEIDGVSIDSNYTTGTLNQSAYGAIMKDWIKKVTTEPDATDTTKYPGGDTDPTYLADKAIYDKYKDYKISYDGVKDPLATGGTTATINITFTAKKEGAAGEAALSGFTFGGITGEQKIEGKDWVPAVPAEYADALSTLSIPIDPETNQKYEIQSYKINEDGTIIGVDKQNRTIAIGQLALVTVENPNGLEKADGYYYTAGANAGDTEAMKPNGGPSGKILGGYLEMANVDLANEFSNMITCQRGFQANSKIITVTDEMLSELVNMKR